MSRIEHDRENVPTFGIVIPVRHMPRELPGAIDSILSQTICEVQVGPKDLDLIVVVDDLDAETARVLGEYGDRIRWMVGDGRGQAAAVNMGLANVTGSIVKWVNADDRLLPGALDTMVRAFEDDPEVDFVYGDTLFQDPSGNTVGGHREPRYSKFVLLYGHNLFADPSCFWRARVNEFYGMISEETKYSLDYEFWVRLVRLGANVAQVRQPIAAFKVTGQNMSVLHRQAMLREHFDILADYYPAWHRVPATLRYRMLGWLLVVARVYKTFLAGMQRGWGEVGTFGRLVARRERE